MAKEQRRFVDDGWAIWIEGEDVSTVYINDWLNPKGKSYVDLAVRISGVKISKALHVYVPFALQREEIEDVSLLFEDKKILQAIFGSACIIDYKKNEYSSEIAYNGKTMDIMHISAIDYQLSSLAEGTLIDVDLEKLKPYIDNDEAYFIWRMPHKSFDEIFQKRMSFKKVLTRLEDLITTPVVSEKYNYSIRINEARRVPDEIARIGSFHRQKLSKAVVRISIDEDYELSDTNCNRIRRLEENLYKDYIPKNYKGFDVITYQWNQDREFSELGHFNFYNNITKNSISRGSMLLYVILLLGVGVAGELLADLVKALVNWKF